MKISYQDVYSRFLQKINDIELAQLPQVDVYEMMCGWMHSALSRPYTRTVFSKLKFYDEIMVLECSLANPVDDDADIEFILELTAMGMTVEWLEPRVKSVKNVAQMFGGKEQKFYSQAAHLTELETMLNDSRVELRKMVRDYGYIHNSYIERE